MTKTKNANGKSQNLAMHIAVGSAVSSCMFFVLLLASASVILRLNLESDSLLVFLILSSAVSTLFGGFIAARKIRKNGLILGVISTLPTVAAALIASAVSSGSAPGINMALAAITMIIFGAVGGILAVNIRKIKK